MNGLDSGGEGGATPLDENDIAGLIPEHLSTQAQLNEWEQQNNLQAQLWMSASRRNALEEGTIRELHRRMFNRTWEWAGHYRRSDKSIGIHWSQIPVAVKNLVADGRIWFDLGTFPVREATARLHHRLVKIHPFPNGNGRVTRLWADMLLLQNREPPFEWGGASSRSTEDPDRQRYLGALRRADEEDYAPLLDFLLGSS